MDFIKKFIAVMKGPSDFFAKLKPNIKNDWLFWLLLSLFSLASTLILSLAVYKQLGSSGGSFGIQSVALLGGASIELGILTWVLMLGLIFVGAGIFHIFAKLYGGKGRYKESFASTVYASVPNMLLTFIGVLIIAAAFSFGTVMLGIVFVSIGGIINLIGAIWALVLLVIGIMKLHKMSAGRAVASVITPIIIILILYLLFISLAG